MQLQALAATTLHSCCTKKATQRNDNCLFSVFPGSSQPVPFELLGEGALPYPSLLTLQLGHRLGIIIQVYFHSIPSLVLLSSKFNIMGKFVKLNSVSRL